MLNLRNLSLLVLAAQAFMMPAFASEISFCPHGVCAPAPAPKPANPCLSHAHNHNVCDRSYVRKNSASSLTGRYVLLSSACVPYLNIEQGNILPQGFEIGAMVNVMATGTQFTLTSFENTQPVESVNYTVGAFDVSGPVSDGPATVTNEYLANGSVFSHGRDNLQLGDHFSKLVFTRTATGMQIEYAGAATCELEAVQ